MEMTELDKAFQEIKVDNIESIDYEISDLEKQISRLRERRNGIMVGDLDFIGKYMKITSLGSNYISYMHVKDMLPNKNGVTFAGETYIVLDTDTQASLEYLEFGKYQYDLIRDVYSYMFEEISEEEFLFKIGEELGKLSKKINK